MRGVSSCLYIVLQVGGEWWVDREGKSYGPCETQQDAEDAAIKLIELFGDPARPAQLWSPGKDGRVHLVWSIGARQSPPGEQRE